MSVFKGWKKLPTEIAESVLGDIQTLHGHSTKRGALVDLTQTKRGVYKGRTVHIFRGLIDNIQRLLPVPMIPSFKMESLRLE